MYVCMDVEGKGEGCKGMGREWKGRKVEKGCKERGGAGKGWD